MFTRQPARATPAAAGPVFVTVRHSTLERCVLEHDAFRRALLAGGQVVCPGPAGCCLVVQLDQLEGERP